MDYAGRPQRESGREAHGRRALRARLRRQRHLSSPSCATRESAAVTSFRRQVLVVSRPEKIARKKAPAQGSLPKRGLRRFGQQAPYANFKNALIVPGFSRGPLKTFHRQLSSE